jgi:bifunctional non-homologous end joining protein LigD
MKSSVPVDDALLDYQSKRDFTRTPEPAQGGESGVEQLVFVVQKHWARSLHYDFRLELDGTMKSWAIPKGPSLDTTVKRMAVQVEDHPLAYARFEGTVPAGQYGAGKVIIWDTGVWTPLHDPAEGYRDGNLKFELHGQKLHGKWVLVRMKGKGEKQSPWLLIKEKDAFARSAAQYSVVDELPASVATLGLPPEAVPCALPETLSPQLARLVVGPPPDPSEWICEIKFDGYRMLVRNNAEGARLFTRNGHDWTAKLRSLQDAFERLKLPSGWYDGEIVIPTEAGIPDFAELQQAFDGEDTRDVILYLFDLPYAAGHDLRRAPLLARRAVLKRLLSIANSERIRLSEEFDGTLEHVLLSACKLGLEGVIAKRRTSTYRGDRSSDWIKLKCGQRQEFVIGGYTNPEGSRYGLGALLLGVHDAHGVLQYAGNVGSGFGQKTLQDLMKTLEPLSRTTSPFAAESKIEGISHWVAPVLVAEVSFGDWTRAGRIRHAVFRGLRTDKSANCIVREKELRMPAVNRPGSRSNKAHLPVSRAVVTHPERVIDASTGTTKIELFRYYGLVGQLMMKHLRGRPVSWVRAPAGVDGKTFFHKHIETEKLAGIRQVETAPGAGVPAMIQVAGAQGLLSAAQSNVIEFHTQNAATTSLSQPDRIVFDLDPGEGVTWVRVQEAAQLMHSFLTQLGLSSFLKTSGGKGLHVVVPVRRLHDWDTVKGFAHAVVLHMARTIPQRFVARSGPMNRVGKIFIDYLRNGLGATTVSAWSARARPGLGISVPVAWNELPSLRGGDHWSVRTVHERLDAGNEPWNEYAKAARGLDRAIEALEIS